MTPRAIDMPSIGDIVAGMRIPLLAELDLFPEGTEGTVKEVRAHEGWA